MKPKRLREITNGQYYVEKRYTHAKDETTICNFYIEKLAINRCIGENEMYISFTVFLVNSDHEESDATFPIVYLFEPFGWLHMGFDTDKFYTTLSKEKFQLHMNNIIRSIKKNVVENKEYIIGWDFSKIWPNRNMRVEELLFWKYEDADSSVGEKDECQIDYIDRYIQLVDKSISVPLISYMLLAVLGSLLMAKTGRRPDFIMSITGADSKTRSKLALFYSNLYKRTVDLYRNDYRYTHIMPEDDLSDVFFKARQYKDSVLIAFEPLKKRSNQLSKMFSMSELDPENPVYSLCLITHQNKTDIPFKTVNITLPDDLNFSKIIGCNFCLQDGENINDQLIDSIYSYIHRMLKRILKREYDIVDMFNAFKQELKQDDRYIALSDEGAEVALYLLFAYKQYVDFTYESGALPSVTTEETQNIIFDLAFNSFPKRGDIINEDYENAQAVCNVLDEYFNEKCVTFIGEKTTGNTRVWVDGNYFYILPSDIKDILILSKSTRSFSKQVKLALAKKELIKTYKTAKGTTEFSVRLQKALYDDVTTKNRYIAFCSKKCRKYGLFKQLCKLQEDHYLKELFIATRSKNSLNKKV